MLLLALNMTSYVKYVLKIYAKLYCTKIRKVIGNDRNIFSSSINGQQKRMAVNLSFPVPSRILSIRNNFQ